MDFIPAHSSPRYLSNNPKEQLGLKWLVSKRLHSPQAVYMQF